jgi:hypothetical protein
LANAESLLSQCLDVAGKPAIWKSDADPEIGRAAVSMSMRCLPMRR